MSKLILCVVLASIVLCSMVEARCKKNEYNCCRRKIDYGRCHHHHRRYAFNSTCGQCVPFDYSGCGGYENNFNTLDECNDCCRGTPSCPKYSLPRPASGCEYKWHDDHHGCPKPNLECGCERLQCRPDSCRHGERCIPEHHHCHKCPCKQYRCVSDPCYPIHHHLRSCEKCVAVPAPHCHHRPCPLIAYRENWCQPPTTTTTTTPAPTTTAPPHHHCRHYFPCHHLHQHPCAHRRCPAHPHARCVVDPCDCRKHHWNYDGHTCSDDECNYHGKK